MKRELNTKQKHKVIILRFKAGKKTVEKRKIIPVKRINAVWQKAS